MRRTWVIPVLLTMLIILVFVVTFLRKPLQQIIVVAPSPSAAIPVYSPVASPISLPNPPLPSTPPVGVDIIVINNPIPNQLIQSPLVVSGQAKGLWFFEATAPVRLIDAQGRQIAQSYITAQGEWMTENFVQFQGELTFSPPGTNTGQLILDKSNPSGLTENSIQVIIPVRFR